MKDNKIKHELDESRVAGCVILYNSELSVIDNIQSYYKQISHLFVVDNSESMELNVVDKIKDLPNVTYIKNAVNQGVAYALNQAATLALEAKYSFLLTMDDDTSIPSGSIKKMLDFLTDNNYQNIGIVAGQSDPRLYSQSASFVDFTITSGNLLNLKAYKECGFFKEDLFIDFVDHEYCFRLRERGYKIIELNYIHLKHKLGSKQVFKILGLNTFITWNSHNPSRIYYKVRNSIFTISQYKSTQNKVKYIFLKEVCKDLIKIIFLEKEKKLRLQLFIKALIDASRGQLGKLTF